MLQRRKCPRRTGWLAGESLEDADMEDIVESCARRQLQPVGHAAHPLQDLEWIIEARTELAAPLDIHGRRPTVQQPKPHPLALLELDVSLLAIICHLVVLLGLLKPVTDLHDELIPIVELLL
jgi:hypothetical protein